MKKLLLMLGLAALAVLPLRAQPVACKFYVSGVWFVVEWCNLAPNTNYAVEWGADVTAFIHEVPPHQSGLMRVQSDGTLHFEIMMTEPILFVRLKEL